MFNPFKKKSKRPTDTRATHFVGRIYNRYGVEGAKRCGTKKSGLLMELKCPDFVVTIRADHIEGRDRVFVHRIGEAEDGIIISELVDVIGDKREPETPTIAPSITSGNIKTVDISSSADVATVYPDTITPPMKIIGGDDIGGRDAN